MKHIEPVKRVGKGAIRGVNRGEERAYYYFRLRLGIIFDISNRVWLWFSRSTKTFV